ncbi:MAG: RpiB/LacA/LacB family sugar-phosphate isomerase [Sideroxydans sp.]
MRVGIASDHGGFALKEQVVELLRGSGHEVVDFGAHLIAVSLTRRRAVNPFRRRHGVMRATDLRTGVSTASALFQERENTWNWA